MSETTAVEAVLKRDRAVVLAGVAGLSALAWAYLLALAGRTPHEDMAMAMPQMHAWGAAEVVLTWVMWAVMMVAMMTPSAAPMILTCATLNRRRRAKPRHNFVYLCADLSRPCWFTVTPRICRCRPFPGGCLVMALWGVVTGSAGLA